MSSRKRLPVALFSLVFGLLAASVASGSNKVGGSAAYVTSDTSCIAPTTLQDNHLVSGATVNVWVKLPVDVTVTMLDYAITSPGYTGATGTLAFVCTDTTDDSTPGSPDTTYGLTLATTDVSGLSSNLGKGSKTSESYTLTLTYNSGPSDGKNFGSNSFTVYAV
jgi:hypothetical protein